MRPVTLSRVHQVAREDEEGHGEQREAFDPGDHALGDDDVGRDVIEDDIKHGCDGHRDGNGHPDQHQHQKRAKKK